MMTRLVASAVFIFGAPCLAITEEEQMANVLETLTELSRPAPVDNSLRTLQELNNIEDAIIFNALKIEEK